MLRRLNRARDYAAGLATTYSAVPARAGHSLARDVFLATMKPDRSQLWQGDVADVVVAGALLAELTREGRLRATGTGTKISVAVRDTSPLGDAILDDTLVLIGSGLLGQRASRLLRLMRPTGDLTQLLTAEGVMSVQRQRYLGLIPVLRYHLDPAAGRDELVTRLREALLGESVPDDRTALLVAVLATGASLARWVPKSEVETAKRCAEGMARRLSVDEQAVVSAIKTAVQRINTD